MKRCFSCFRNIDIDSNLCPYCGQQEITAPLEPIHLTPGTILRNRYILGLAIGSGGFGIVYKAWDTKLERVVAVKEFYVSRLVTRAADMTHVSYSRKSANEFEYRMKRFLAEARDMARFENCDSIPDVIEYFEENNTAYIVMELLTGMTLNEYLNQDQIAGKVSKDFTVVVALKVAEALRELHNQGIIHRDVAPDNIYICSGNGLDVKLMDLGAAKLADSTEDVIDIILKPGFSPVEQYDNTKNIGPWSDIYALGATMYTMLTGVKPDESTNRKINDTVVPPNQLNPYIPDNLNNIIMRAMAVEKHLRFKTVDEFINALEGDRPIDLPDVVAKKRKLRRFISIVAACLVVSIISGIMFNSYNNKKAEEILKPANIVVWVMKTDTGESKNNSCNRVKDWLENNFNKQKGNEKVNVKVVMVDESEYYQKLQNALQNNTGEKPDLYESTRCENNDYALDLDDVMKESDFKNCSLLKTYKDYCKAYKRLPLAVDIPVIYDLSNLSGLDFYSELGNGDDCLIEDTYMNSFDDNFEKNKMPMPVSFDEYITNTNYFRKRLLLSSSESFEKINAVALKNDSMSFKAIYPDLDSINFDFTFEWSISNSSSEDEIRACKKILRFMLNPEIMRQICWYKIPVNSDALSANFQPINEVAGIYSKLKYEVS